MQKAHKVNLTFQLKRGTAARWIEMNPVLADGEPGFELDTNQLKIGNGKDTWTNLPYLTDTASLVTEEELANAIDIAKEEILNQSGLYELNYDKTANEIKLTNKNTGEVSTISTLDFIKDGMIKEVRLSSSGKELVITWNTDAGKEATRISLASFIDIYSSKNTDTVNMSVDNNVFFARVNPESLNNSHLTPNANIAASKLSQEVRDDLARAATAVQPEILEDYALAEETNRKMDDIFVSTQHNNCLKKYNPNLIKMEYTNRAGGWKASIKDENTGEEIHGASLFTRHNIDGWQEHSIEFVNDNTTNATFQIYSVSKEPGVVQIDDVKITQMDINPNGLYYDWKRSPDDFSNSSGFWTWPTSSMASPNGSGQAVIISGKNTWAGYITAELHGLNPGGMYYVDIDIAQVNTGGVNFKIIDQNGNIISLYEASKIRESMYLNKTGITRLYFVTPSGPISLQFSGSNSAPEDNLIINSCVVRQSNSTSWGEVNSTLDHGWVLNESWYTWGKNVEFDGEQVVQFSTSAAESYIRKKKRILTLNANTHYRFEFDAYRVSGGLAVTIEDANGVVIAKPNVSKSCAEGWGHYEVVFVPTTDICTASIAMIWGETLQYDVYIKNLNIKPIQPYSGNIIANSDFSVDEYADGTTIKTGQANWTLGKASSIVDGAAQLAVQEGNTTTYVPGCSQAITLVPGNTYKISFKSKSIEHTPMWMPYITFTNEDKQAFMADWKDEKYEDLVFGGPWIKGSAEHYAARVTVEGEVPINAKYLCINAGIWSSSEFEVDVKIKHGEEMIYFQKHNLSPGISSGSFRKYYLPLPEDFVFTGVDSIELTFMVNEIIDNECRNQISNVNILGNFVIANHYPEPDYYVFPDGRVGIQTLMAERVIANIDDGSLDWEV